MPFWYRLTWVVPEKGPLNGCVCVCVRVCHLKKQPQNKSVFLRTYALETFLTTMLYKSTFTIPYYNNVALPASHAFANRCCCKLSSNRSISPARWAHSSKPAAADFLLWAHAGTDRRTDTVPSHRSCSGLVMQAHSHPFNGPLSGKAKPVWILLKQETVSGSGISWAICKSVPHSRQITTPAPHHSFFYRPDALPAAQPTASKQYRQCQQKFLMPLCRYVRRNAFAAAENDVRQFIGFLFLLQQVNCVEGCVR